MKGKHKASVVARQARLESERIAELEAEVTGLRRQLAEKDAAFKQELKVALAQEVARAKAAIADQLQAEIDRAAKAEREATETALKVGLAIRHGYDPKGDTEPFFNPGQWAMLYALFGSRTYLLTGEEGATRKVRRRRARGLEGRLREAVKQSAKAVMGADGKIGFTTDHPGLRAPSEMQDTL